MARLVDVIEMMIKQMLEENDGSIVVNRSMLADKANCVPSQITYVLSTRFTNGNGYIVESRRGGGGQIYIRKVQQLSKHDYIQNVIDEVSNELTQEQARMLLQNMVGAGAITAREGVIVMSTVSDRALAKVDSIIRSEVRADIFRNSLLALMVE